LIAILTTNFIDS